MNYEKEKWPEDSEDKELKRKQKEPEDFCGYRQSSTGRKK